MFDVCKEMFVFARKNAEKVILESIKIAENGYGIWRNQEIQGNYIIREIKQQTIKLLGDEYSVKEVQSINH